MKERLILFGILFWSIDRTDAVLDAPQLQQYGICIDVTLCQRPPYPSICSQGLPICPSPSATKTTLAPSPTTKLVSSSVAPSSPSPTVIVTTTNGVLPTSTSITPAATLTTQTIPSTPVQSHHLNVITIQNNIRIEFGKKSNVTH